MMRVMDRGFSIAVEASAPGSHRIAISGELDLAVADRLNVALEEIPARATVLIDLRKCTFIDSTGLASIVKGRQRREASGGNLAVFGAADQVRRLFEVVGLAEDGLAYESLEEASSALASARS
jgi:anti-sigma B factor antagonist